MGTRHNQFLFSFKKTFPEFSDRVGPGTRGLGAPATGPVPSRPVPVLTESRAPIGIQINCQHRPAGRHSFTAGKTALTVSRTVCCPWHGPVSKIKK
jgi:hypothetical protein